MRLTRFLLATIGFLVPLAIVVIGAHFVVKYKVERFLNDPAFIDRVAARIIEVATQPRPEAQPEPKPQPKPEVKPEPAQVPVVQPPAKNSDMFPAWAQEWERQRAQ